MLDKLRTYKELISIMLFFLGGFFWINQQFPSKQDLSSEINALNCLLEKYMTLTQLQIRSQSFDKALNKLANQINSMSETELSPPMKFQLKELISDFEHKKNALRVNTQNIENMSDELARNVCKKVSL